MLIILGWVRSLDHLRSSLTFKGRHISDFYAIRDYTNVERISHWERRIQQFHIMFNSWSIPKGITSILTFHWEFISKPVVMQRVLGLWGGILACIEVTSSNLAWHVSRLVQKEILGRMQRLCGNIMANHMDGHRNCLDYREGSGVNSVRLNVPSKSLPLRRKLVHAPIPYTEPGVGVLARSVRNNYTCHWTGWVQVSSVNQFRLPSKPRTAVRSRL